MSVIFSADTLQVVYGGTGYHVGDIVEIRDDSVALNDQAYDEVNYKSFDNPPISITVTSVDSNGAITGWTSNYNTGANPYLAVANNVIPDENSWGMRTTAQNRYYIVTTTPAGVVTKVFESDRIALPTAVTNPAPPPTSQTLLTSYMAAVTSTSAGVYLADPYSDSYNFTIIYGSTDGSFVLATGNTGTALAGQILKFQNGSRSTITTTDPAYVEYVKSYLQPVLNKSNYDAQLSTYSTSVINYPNSTAGAVSSAVTSLGTANTDAAAQQQAGAVIAAMTTDSSIQAMQNQIVANATACANALAAYNASSSAAASYNANKVARLATSADGSFVVDVINSGGVKTFCMQYLDSYGNPTGSPDGLITVPDSYTQTNGGGIVKIANVSKDTFAYYSSTQVTGVTSNVTNSTGGSNSYNTPTVNVIYIYKKTSGTWALKGTFPPKDTSTGFVKQQSPSTYNSSNTDYTTYYIPGKSNICWAFNPKRNGSNTSRQAYFDVYSWTGVDSVSDDGTSLSLQTYGYFSVSGFVQSQVSPNLPVAAYGSHGSTTFANPFQCQSPGDPGFYRKFPEMASTPEQGTAAAAAYNGNGVQVQCNFYYGHTNNMVTGPVLFDIGSNWSGNTTSVNYPTPYWSWFVGTDVQYLGDNAGTSSGTNCYNWLWGDTFYNTVIAKVTAYGILTTAYKYMPAYWKANSSHTRLIAMTAPTFASSNALTQNSSFGSTTGDSEVYLYQTLLVNKTSTAGWAVIDSAVATAAPSNGGSGSAIDVNQSNKCQVITSQAWSPLTTAYYNGGNNGSTPVTPSNGQYGVSATSDLMPLGITVSTGYNGTYATSYEIKVNDGSNISNITPSGTTVITPPGSAPTAPSGPPAGGAADTAYNAPYSIYAPPPAVVTGGTPGKSGSFTGPPTYQGIPALGNAKYQSPNNKVTVKAWKEFDTANNPNNCVTMNGTWHIASATMARLGRYVPGTTTYQVTVTDTDTPSNPVMVGISGAGGGNFGQVNGITSLSPQTQGQTAASYVHTPNYTVNVAVYTPPTH